MRDNESMKILVVSDTHGQAYRLEEVLAEEAPVDAIIHCGDVEGEEEYIQEIAGCPCFIVAGNNDYFTDMSRELEFVLGGKRFFLTHGHYYGVSINMETLREEGESRNADIVLFGHTHRPYIEEDDTITLINPGSLTYPRQRPRRASYLIMEIDASGKTRFTPRFL